MKMKVKSRKSDFTGTSWLSVPELWSGWCKPGLRHSSGNWDGFGLGQVHSPSGWVSEEIWGGCTPTVWDYSGRRRQQEPLIWTENLALDDDSFCCPSLGAVLWLALRSCESLTFDSGWGVFRWEMQFCLNWVGGANGWSSRGRPLRRMNSPGSLGIDERHGRRGFVDLLQCGSQARIIDSVSVCGQCTILEKAPCHLASAGRFCVQFLSARVFGLWPGWTEIATWLILPVAYACLKD